MAFKQKPDKKARLEDLNKTTLIKTIKTLQRRETKLLNQVAALTKAQDTLAGATAVAGLAAVERWAEPVELSAVGFGYLAGEKGEWNLEMTLLQWGRHGRHFEAVRSTPTTDALSSTALDDALEVAPRGRFPWEDQQSQSSEHSNDCDQEEGA